MGYDFSQVAFLVVDDNAHMRRLVRSLLQAFGASHILEAADGSAALKHMTAQMPDVVITDFMMQPMDGVSFTRKLRNEPGKVDPFVPVIMMTGYTDMERVIEARDAGVTEFVAKPLTASSLYSRLAAVIEHPRPFVRTDRYFGPDRRRRQEPYDVADRRRRPPETVAMASPQPIDDDLEIEWN